MEELPNKIRDILGIMVAMTLFRQLARKGRRLDEEQLDASNAALLEKLDLIDGNYLKRAAVLLFHAEPECIFTGAFVKTGYFQTESELLYHEEIHGDLFTQAQKTLDLLTTKYLKAIIGYVGIHCTETLPVPEEALREAILEAQISIMAYSEKSSGKGKNVVKMLGCD